MTDDTEHFFVADGYCNSRIIKYSVRIDSDGKHVVQKEFQGRYSVAVVRLTVG